MALLTPGQSALLKFDGFAQQFETYWQQGLTQPQAFAEANRDVELLTGEKRYPNDEFGAFVGHYKKTRERRK